MSRTRARAALLAVAAVAPGLARAYSWTFGSTPTQCQNATINIVGDDGTPPYNIVILAYGNPPGGNETRKIIDHTFNDKQTSVQVAFPSNSQFVAVVSDAKAFGSGGTSVSVSTVSSDDTSCLPTPGSLSPGFTFYTPDSPTKINQCTPLHITYSASAQGAVHFYGVIPGGNSFSFDPNGAVKASDNSMSFNWTPNVPQFTDMILMAGDGRGHGSGGSTATINVGDGTKTCLTGTYPISTPGTPAGGVYQTDTSGGKTGGGSTDSGGGTNIGAIVGGVIGALVFVIIILAGLLFWFWRRRRIQQRNAIQEKPDLTDDPRPANVAIATGHANNRNLEAEPFIVPPSVTSGSRPQTPSSATGLGGAVPPSAWVRQNSGEHRQGGSRPSMEEGSTGGLSAWERKHGAAGGPQLRPVNVIQHDDGGAVENETEAAETVELPPAYGSVRPNAKAQPPAQ